MLLLHRADARRRRGARHAGALHRRAGHAREHPYHYPVLHVLQEQRADRAARGTGGFVRRRARGTLTPTLLDRSEEHTSELQSLMRISYAVFCLKKKNK